MAFEEESEEFELCYNSDIPEEEALKCYKEGLLEYESGEFLKSISIWSSKCEAFYKSKETVFGLKEIVTQYNLKNLLEEQVVRFFEKARNNNLNLKSFVVNQKSIFDGEMLEVFYPLYLNLFFSLGIAPELYTEKDRVWEERQRRKALLSENKEIINKYKLGVLELYLGNIDLGVSILSEVNDSMPNTKSRSLKSRKIVSFSRDLIYQINNLV